MKVKGLIQLERLMNTYGLKHNNPLFEEADCPKIYLLYIIPCITHYGNLQQEYL